MRDRVVRECNERLFMGMEFNVQSFQIGYRLRINCGGCGSDSFNLA